MRLGDAHRPELLLQHQRERRGKREQRIAVQSKQQPDQHGRNARRDVAGELPFGERAVDQRDGRKRIDRDVIGGREARGAWFPLGEGMAGPAERRELVVEQLKCADIRRLHRPALDVDDEMTAPVAERIGVLIPVRLHPAEPLIRCERLEPLAERLHQNKLARFARGDGEIAHRKRRIERLVRPEQALHARKDDVHGGGKLERLRGRHELLPGADE